MVAAALVLLAVLASACSGARILALVSTPSPSHHIFNRALTIALARKGHHVTLFTPDPEKESVPNYREIIFDGAYDGLHDTFDYENFVDLTRMEEVGTLFQWGLFTCERALQSNGARQLLALAANETFDLVIVEVVFNECLLGFVNKFGSPPMVGISAYVSPPWANSLMGNELNPSYVNTYTLPYTDHMTFFQRMANFLLDWYVAAYRTFSYMPQQDKIARRFFGDSVPPPSVIERNISLVMVNTHFSTDYPRPHVPAIVPVGGMQAKPAQPLPKDLQRFLDESQQGVVFFSLGTNVRSDQLGQAAVGALLAAFAELPLNVLWKWESDDLPGRTNNVHTAKWLPQNDVLAHRNVRAFITHSGMLSTMEAVYHGVPMVGIPFLADQYANLAKSEAHGIAIRLDYRTLTKEVVLHALNKVLNDTSYRDRIKRLSAIYRDRPQAALETAVYWTEYVLRHGGAHHLRCASLDLSWYQRVLLDVLAFLLLMTAAFCLLLYFLLNRIVSSVVWNTKKHKKM